MFKRLLSAAVVMCAGFTAPAQASLIEFNSNDLFMEFSTGGGYSPNGTFRFDTDTFAVTDVDITTPFGTYTSGSHAGGPISAFQFSDGLTNAFFEINYEVSQLNASLALGGKLGDGVALDAEPFEFVNGSTVGSPADPSLYGRVVRVGPEQTPVVPLPAGLPLLLFGMGIFAMVGRRS